MARQLGVSSDDVTVTINTLGDGQTQIAYVVLGDHQAAITSPGFNELLLKQYSEVPGLNTVLGMTSASSTGNFYFTLIRARSKSLKEQPSFILEAARVEKQKTSVD